MDSRTILEEMYVEYLASSLGQTTATELARLSHGTLSHDQITRALAGEEHGSRELWEVVKALVRKRSLADGQRGGVLIIDDTLLAKPHSDLNEVIGWYFDHTEGRYVKGINVLTLFWESDPEGESEAVRLPTGYEVVRKDEPKETGERARTRVDKNTLFRGLLRQARANGVPFEAVLGDCWFASEENMEMIHQELESRFVFALKANRLAVPVEENRRQAKWKQLTELELEEDCARVVWLRGVSFPVAVVRHRYRNVDGSVVDVFLCTNAVELSAKQILALQKRRWSIEVYHKSLKQNAAAARAPLWSVRTLLNHLWASLCAYVRWERLKLRKGLNHFALKAKIRLAAQKRAMDAFQELSTA